MLTQQRLLRVSFYYFLMVLLPTVESIWNDLNQMKDNSQYTEAFVLVLITTYVYCLVKVMLFFLIFTELAHGFRNHVLRPGWDYLSEKIPEFTKEIKKELMGF